MCNKEKIVMAKDRQIPCIYYASELNCKKGREGTFNKYCKRCYKYEPRVKMKIKNRKK